MSIAKWKWKPRDVERALGVARRQGFAVTGYTIGAKGDITVTVATGTPLDGNETPNPWDCDHAADAKRPT